MGHFRKLFSKSEVTIINYITYGSMVLKKSHKWEYPKMKFLQHRIKMKLKKDAQKFTNSTLFSAKEITY